MAVQAAQVVSMRSRGRRRARRVYETLGCVTAPAPRSLAGRSCWMSVAQQQQQHEEDTRASSLTPTARPFLPCATHPLQE